MKVFKSFDIDYDDIIQLDGASPFAHKMYSSSSLFHGIDGQETSEKRSDYKLSEKMTEDIINLFVSSDTTEKNIKEKDRIELWKEYWLEYIGSSAFISTSPACRTLVWPPKGVFRIGRTWLS